MEPMKREKTEEDKREGRRQSDGAFSACVDPLFSSTSPSELLLLTPTVKATTTLVIGRASHRRRPQFSTRVLVRRRFSMQAFAKGDLSYKYYSCSGTGQKLILAPHLKKERKKPTIVPSMVVLRLEMQV